MKQIMYTEILVNKSRKLGSLLKKIFSCEEDNRIAWFIFIFCMQKLFNFFNIKFIMQ